ncbi:hypothetical protein ACIBEA_04375 [Streptomyces sp. NPDC051555]|uniref:hypothetical protein n=1 Tax=Streptomyces sp. NPDC051555 TaxID=3365657 RepID=UPI003795C072
MGEGVSAGNDGPVWEPVVVPGPEPDWRPAPEYQGGNPNPAMQYGMWDSMVLAYRPIGVLPPPFTAYVERLVLTVEQSWEDLGSVDVAVFRLGGHLFALSQFTDGGDAVTVWLDRRARDGDGALAALAEVLGVPGDCVRDITWSPHPATRYEATAPTPATSPRKRSGWGGRLAALMTVWLPGGRER